jgi:hypothetical protein
VRSTAFATPAERRFGALLVHNDAFLSEHRRQQIIALADKDSAIERCDDVGGGDGTLFRQSTSRMGDHWRRASAQSLRRGEVRNRRASGGTNQ